MKNFKKFLKTGSGKLFIVFLSCTLIAIPMCARADDWEGWTDEKKEEAMVVYAMTDWQEIEGIYFTENGSYATADVSEEFRDSYENLVENVLADSENGLYSSGEYKELILSIMYVLNDWKWNDDSSVDVCLYNKFINNLTTVTSPEQSVSLLYQRLLECEQAYSEISSEPASIFRKNNELGSVIQGVVYGSNYTATHISYSKNNASEYYDENEDNIYTDYDKQMDKFAQKVLNIYNAVEADAHTVIG